MQVLAQLRGVRHPAVRHGRARSGHRPRDRSRAGLHATRDDDRLRRQPHVDARATSRAGRRHRDERGRARARPRRSRRRCRRTLTVTVDGTLPEGVTAKDVVDAIINRLGTAGGIGSIIEYRGSTIRALSMEGRMTVCNMSIEAGARAGMVAPDDTTFAYLEGHEFAPKGRARSGSGRSTTGGRSSPPDSRRDVRPRARARRRRDPPDGHVGHEPHAVRRHRRRGARPRLLRRRRQGRTPPSAPSPTWA